MKIRNGFVSNSSSSSFVVFGQETTLKGAEKHIKDGHEVIALVEGWENPILINITTIEMLSYVLYFESTGKQIYSTYAAYSWGFEDGGNKVDLSTLPKTGTAVLDGGYCDQFSINSINDLPELFDDDWAEAKIGAKKFIRKEKLNEIEKNG